MNEVRPLASGAELIVQRVHPVSAAQKRELLAYLIATNGWREVLVFTRTRHGADRLADQLVRGGIGATAIHGTKSHAQRARALADFKAGVAQVLIATDIAGFDIEPVPRVVNFDMPHAVDDYMHRIGRTALSGTAISLVAPEEQRLLAAVEKHLGRDLEREVITGFASGEAVPDPKGRQETRRVRKEQQPAKTRRNARERHSQKPVPEIRDLNGYEERQPSSNEGQLFPSSAQVFGDPRTRTPFAGPRRGRSASGAPPGGRRRNG